MSLFKNILKILGVDYSLSYFFNFGSFLGMVMVVQIISGILLIIVFTPNSDIAFFSVQYLIYEVNFGWIIRLLHFNGASLLFFFLYLHFFKALFFGS
jgi:quinol-cytochrome oxidoreductase complex cytochrome b subunit